MQRFKVETTHDLYIFSVSEKSTMLETVPHNSFHKNLGLLCYAQTKPLLWTLILGYNNVEQSMEIALD